MSSKKSVEKIETRGRPKREDGKTECKFFRIWFTPEDLEAFEKYCEDNASTPVRQIEKFIKSVIKKK